MKRFKKILAVSLAAALCMSTTSLSAFAAAQGSGEKTNAELKKESVEKEFDGTFFSATGFATVDNKKGAYYSGTCKFFLIA